MAFAILLVTSLAIGVTFAQFAPGCSFNDGQCMYNVQLGHQGQCDKRAVTSGDGQCCDTLQSQMTSVTSDINTLKSQVSSLMSDLSNSKNNLTVATDQLAQTQIRTQQLLDALAQKESELNTTQSELSHVLEQAGDEIRTLRAKVGSLTSELNRCKGTLGLATNTSSLPVSAILPADVTMYFCDFEHHEADDDVMCGYRNHSNGFVLGAGRQSSRTGPLEDHTFGSPHGHYLFMDATAIAKSTTHSSAKTFSISSQQYPPGPGYCIRFWYNMFGNDVKSFSVYANVGTGSGYPVFSRTGNIGQQWNLGEVDLDREYTSHPFNLTFSATTTAYHSGSYNTLYYTAGDVALDDIYVYNTSCKNVPLCPSGSVTREEGSTTYCYTFHVQPVTWYQAASLCRQQSATTSLVTITSHLEQDFIVSAIKNDSLLMSAGQNGFYTAGNDERSEHTFDWTDTGTPYRGTYSNWKSGQPNNVADDQDCLLLQYPDLDFKWGDVDCDERHSYICKTEYPTAKAAATSGSPVIG